MALCNRPEALSALLNSLATCWGIPFSFANPASCATAAINLACAALLLGMLIPLRQEVPVAHPLAHVTDGTHRRKRLDAGPLL